MQDLVLLLNSVVPPLEGEFSLFASFRRVQLNLNINLFIVFRFPPGVE